MQVLHNPDTGLINSLIRLEPTFFLSEKYQGKILFISILFSMFDIKYLRNAAP